MEKVESFKFLGVHITHITHKLKWSTHTDNVVKKAQQCLFNLRRLKKFGFSPKTLTNFYRCTIKSILSAVSQPGTEMARLSRWWCGLHNASPRANCLPSLTPYSTRCHRKAKKIIKEFNHPSHYLFTPLPSRRQGQYSCIEAGTERLKNSFYLKAIRLLQHSLTQRGCCLTLRPQSLATLINGSLVTLYYAL